MKISIIMPTYNRANYIIETVQSIQDQTYTNWELLIMDDGSEDETEVLVRELGDSRIQFVKLGRIGINSKVKNVGVKHASGELLAFMDSDDLWPPGKLETQYNLLLQYSDAGFSLTNVYNFGEDRIPFEYYYTQREGHFCGNAFIDFCEGQISPFIQTLMVWKKNFIEVGGFDERYDFSDYTLIGKLCYAYRLLLLYEVLLYRRIHNSNDNTSDWTKAYKENFETLQLFIDRKMLPHARGSKILFKININMAQQYAAHGQKRKAISRLLTAWHYAPASIVPFKKIIKTIISW